MNHILFDERNFFCNGFSLIDLFRAAFKKSEESNDEIRAWREERRRNYPTRLNIQRKVKLLSEYMIRRFF